MLFRSLAAGGRGGAVRVWDPATGREIPAPMELVRLAIPRRVYTQSHIDYVVEVILEVWKNRDRIRGLKLSHEAPFLRHFTARLEPLDQLVTARP